MHKYEKSCQKRKKKGTETYPKRGAGLEEHALTQQCETKREGETKMQISEWCTGKIETIASPRLLDESCK